MHRALAQEGRAAAGRAAAAEGQGTLPAVPPGASLKKEGTVPPVPFGAFVISRRRSCWSRSCRPMPSSRSRSSSRRRRALAGLRGDGRCDYTLPRYCGT